ncbi:hypothetical protein [Rhizobium phaseoli]|uniref:hypothetical protein n=1 Tax=Rhizobium phaseoli TaxID=396 RepID=UPI0025532D4F|nr:hypothetical protein [Rhizobium phaseoli]MDK4730330.1 hypothetical protein [Rhizobium phaseoli]
MRSDNRASYKHFALLEFHWGWAHKKFNWTSLASVRSIHATLKARNPLGKAPLSLPHINAGNRDLVDWGWLIELEKGSGRNASRFIPNYTLFQVAAEGNFGAFLDGDIIFSVHPVGEHNGFGISVHPMGNSSVTYEVNANRFCVHPAGNKDPLTGTGLQAESTERETDPAPASPPVAVGLAATAPGSAGGGFEELWRAYNCKQKKAEAKAAYAKLAPDRELHVRMVEAANKWFSRWAEQGKADAPRFTLAKWLDREEYECEPPTSYQAKERKRKDEAVKPAARPRGPRVVDIHDADLDYSGTGSTVLVVIFSDRDRPTTWERRIVLEDKNMDRQRTGQQEFAQLVNALGLVDVSDAAELCGRAVTVTEHAGEEVRYTPANDNDLREAA